MFDNFIFVFANSLYTPLDSKKKWYKISLFIEVNKHTNFLKIKYSISRKFINKSSEVRPI